MAGCLTAPTAETVVTVTLMLYLGSELTEIRLSPLVSYEEVKQ